MLPVGSCVLIKPVGVGAKVGGSEVGAKVGAKVGARGHKKFGGSPRSV